MIREKECPRCGEMLQEVEDEKGNIYLWCVDCNYQKLSDPINFKKRGK